MTAPLASWTDEKQSSHLYRVLAEVEAGTPRAKLFERLARAADKQAGYWAARVVEQGGTLPAYAPDLRVRVVARLARALGPRRIMPVLAAMKVRGLSVYTHAAPGHAMPISASEVGLRHRGAGSGGTLRAAVFGVNDGLVSNASLILGVTGATSDPRMIALSGIAGLLAGAFSMAAGEYISVLSQREVFEYQIGLERDELAEYPKEEAAELALIYEARGVPKPDADRMARQIIADPERALDALAREELGLDPDALGSAWGAAIFSFLSFAGGAAVPLVPFLVASAAQALPLAMTLAAVALFAVGASLSLFTGKSTLWSGARMLLIGAGAGAATYAIGTLLGVAVN